MGKRNRTSNTQSLATGKHENKLRSITAQCKVKIKGFFKPPSKWRVVSIAVVSVCIFALVTSLLLNQTGNASSMPINTSQAEFSSPISMTSSRGIAIVSESFDAQPAPDISFSQQDIERLNALLDAWAAVSEEGETTGHNVALYCKDLESGAEYFYNPDKKFFIASLNKAPYAMYLYHLLALGQCSLEETFYITPEAVAISAEHSGVIKNEPNLPRNYTLEELLYYLLRHSDTVALRFLLGRYPAKGYVEFITSFGLHYPEDVGDVINGRVTALDAGVYLEAMHQYIQVAQNGNLLKENLLQSQYPMIRSEYPVAHKYGWDIGAYHDMAIVYAPHPYLLAIVTDKDAGTPAELGMFGTLSKTIESMLQEKWALYETTL